MLGDFGLDQVLALLKTGLNITSSNMADNMQNSASGQYGANTNLSNGQQPIQVNTTNTPAASASSNSTIIIGIAVVSAVLALTLFATSKK